MNLDRRRVLLAAASAALLPAAIARAASIDARVRTGTLADVEHVVVLMQENRSFDHYFGALSGVRGFGDRFPIPVADAGGQSGLTVWTQVGGHQANGAEKRLSPFPLSTAADFAVMRIEGTPHTWPDAQGAWDEGRMARWPTAKTERSMGYFTRDDIPFQYALADAFTICDAYHCAIQAGTNPNRLFLWSGCNDPHGAGGGPALTNSHDSLVKDGGHPDGYRWTTYLERLQAAGVTWRIYQDMADNFSDNPAAGFKSFRDSLAGAPGADPVLAARGLSTRALDGLRADAVSGALPQVSYIVAPAKDSEHPGPSSPAQGAAYTASVIDALTANPEIWAKTVLLVMYDENDGFFDHVPPPAPPSMADGAHLGGSTVDTTGEYHLVQAASEAAAERASLMGRPYGLGPRVPLFVISPWSRGGWVNSQVFDHTSVIRFLELRFGVIEPNISPWRRAVCGDLTSAFDFKTPNAAPLAALPDPRAAAARAAALPGHRTPRTPALPPAPEQAVGTRPSRALPYALRIEEATRGRSLELSFHNDGAVGAVFHVYDRLHLDRVPRRYTVGAGEQLEGAWPGEVYDLWVLGPGGFHRHFVGAAATDRLATAVALDASASALTLTLENRDPGVGLAASVTASAYKDSLSAWTPELAPLSDAARRWSLTITGGWYDLTIRQGGGAPHLRRLAGRLETGAPSISDPAMAGPALMRWS